VERALSWDSNFSESRPSIASNRIPGSPSGEGLGTAEAWVNLVEGELTVELVVESCLTAGRAWRNQGTSRSRRSQLSDGRRHLEFSTGLGGDETECSDG